MISFDREVQTTRSPIEQANPECRFQLFNFAGSRRAARCGAFWPLAENFRPGRFPRRTLIAADRKRDNKKVSFDRLIIFELFMIRLQMRGMQETKEFDLDLVNKYSARVSTPLIANPN